MNKYIVITTIFEPSDAIAAFASLDEYRVVIAGDRKTPKNWSLNGVEYLTLERQKGEAANLCKLLPYNHYSRKMTAYIYAIRRGADFIIDSDDDNIPKHDWNFPPLEGQYDVLRSDTNFINIYKYYTNKNIWPRGFPLQEVKNLSTTTTTKKNCEVGVWQGLSDENPDVDAIYRLTINEPCVFDTRDPVVLEKQTLSPFNSQNTLTRKELFQLLYLPAFVSFRFTDILRGLVAQPIMWLYDFHLGFTGATTVQKRNPHNYLEDFNSEIPMYRFGAQVPAIVSASINSKNKMSDNLFDAYQALEKNKIVVSKELKTLEAWLKELDSL